MGANAILLTYQARIVALHAAASQLRLGQMIALAIMTAAIVATLVLGFLSIARHTIRLPASLIPAPLAIYAGIICKRRNSGLLQALRLKTYYERGINRLEGRWASSGATGEEFARPGHCYSMDLHVLGKGSLFELLCTCGTEAGRRRLADYLLDAPNLEEAKRRQEAVQELQDKTELREKVNLLGCAPSQEPAWSEIMEWLESPVTPVHSYVRALAFLMSISIAVLLLAGFDSVIAWSHLAPWIGGILLLNAIWGLMYRTRLLNSLRAIRAVGLEASVLRQGLSLLREQTFHSALLSQLVHSAGEHNPPVRIRKLERLTRTLEERNKEWFYAISRALLIGTQVFWAIEKWRVQYARSPARMAARLGRV